MKSLLAIIFSFIFLHIAAQQKVEIGVNSSCAFPVSTFKWHRYQPIEQNGGVIKNGWGADMYILHHPVKYFFYGLSLNYSQYKTDYTNLFTRMDYFINNSVNPSQYDGTKYNYTLRGDRWHLVDVAIPVGVQAKVKKVYLSANIRVGTLIAFAPIVYVDEYEAIPNQQPNQFIGVFIKTTDRFPPKTVILFSYGCDLKIGYEVYKNLNVFTGFTYTGSTNADIKYFDNPDYGYKKTIQSVGVVLGISYDLSLKKRKRT